MTEFFNNSNSTFKLSHEKYFNRLLLSYTGIYSIVLFIISFSSNLILILILLKHKNKLLVCINYQILAVSILCLLETLIDLPLVIITCFKKR